MQCGFTPLKNLRYKSQNVVKVSDVGIICVESFVGEKGRGKKE